MGVTPERECISEPPNQLTAALLGYATISARCCPWSRTFLFRARAEANAALLPPVFRWHRVFSLQEGVG
jgi:hypothetical protein